MNDIVQELMDGLDKTTENGFTEALLIAISNVKNKDGLLVNVTLCDDFDEHIGYIKQIAKMMLKGQS
jgi:hypothetical protein